ncbi:hypothetical protein ACFVGY_15745 [Streptomyces sp. NPDC127106]|uniref:hypothetical protein n=1 Tax=Streptomyces sp. NPDC127106 TaxID=3345360 RepID=UPI003637539D
MTLLPIEVLLNPPAPKLTAQVTGITDWKKGTGEEKDKDGRIAVAVKGFELHSIFVRPLFLPSAQEACSKLATSFVPAVKKAICNWDAGIPVTGPLTCKLPVPDKAGETVGVTAANLRLATFDDMLLISGDLTIS